MSCHLCTPPDPISIFLHIWWVERDIPTFLKVALALYWSKTFKMFVVGCYRVSRPVGIWNINFKGTKTPWEQYMKAQHYSIPVSMSLDIHAQIQPSLTAVSPQRNCGVPRSGVHILLYLLYLKCTKMHTKGPWKLIFSFPSLARTSFSRPCLKCLNFIHYWKKSIFQKSCFLR